MNTLLKDGYTDKKGDTWRTPYYVRSYKILDRSIEYVCSLDIPGSNSIYYAYGTQNIEI